jgi:mRNA interferase MazF
MGKNFNDWNEVKKKIDRNQKPPFFNEREIWWCNIGLNIGSEIYGKGQTFTRPILIIRKFSQNSLLALPLTTKVKDRFSYYKFSFKEKEICAALSEIKKIDSRRLADKIGELSNAKFDDVKREVGKIIFNPQ